MKSFLEIQEQAEKGDYSRVAQLVSVSPSLVRMVVSEVRKDHHNIQRTFSDMLEQRERLAEREERRRIRSRKLMAA